MKKRLLSWLLVLTMVISLIPSTLVTTALAAELPANAPDLTFTGDSAEITKNSAYTLTGDLTGKTVTVKNNAVVTLVLDGVTMSDAASPLRLAEGASVTLIVKDGTTNTITCTATAADTTNNGMTAGISVPQGTTLTIDTPDGGAGDGKLTVTGGYGGAGIGGGAAYKATTTFADAGAAGNAGASTSADTLTTPNYKKTIYGGSGGRGGQGGANGAAAETPGTVNIKNGIISTTGGTGGAGLGGGMGYTGGVGSTGVTGNPGQPGQYWTPLGFQTGRYFVGGGGGGAGGQGGTGGTGGAGGTGAVVNISGGTVVAVGGTNAAGIGGGAGGQGGTGGTGGNGGAGGASCGTNWANTNHATSFTGDSGLGGAAGLGGWGGAGGNGGAGGTLKITGGNVSATGFVGVGGGGHGTNGTDGAAGTAGGPTTKGGYGWTDQSSGVYFVGGGTGGTPQQRAKPAASQNGANSFVTVDGTHDGCIWTDFKNTAQELSVNDRPKDTQGNDLYLYTLTVTDLDGNKVPDAQIKIKVKVSDKAEYTYNDRSNEQGQVQLWLPKGTHTLNDTDVYEPTIGSIPADASVSLQVQSDGGASTVRIGSPYTEVVVKGMGKPQGGTDYTEPLYSYTTFIKADLNKQKLDAIGQSGWKLKNVTVESGGTDFVDENNVPLYEKDLANHNVKVLLKSGGKVEVTFLYDYNRAPVTINSYYEGINGQTVYAPFTIEAEIGKAFTFNQPLLDGYDTVRSDPTTPTITVTGTDDHIDFYYTKSKGHVTYKAVDEADNVLKQVTEDLTKGAAIETDDTKAGGIFGTIPYYTLKAGSGTAVNAESQPVTTYDGRSDVTVTFTYTRNTRNVKVIRWDSDTNTKIDEVTLDNGGAGFPAGEHATLTPSAPAGYTQIGGDPSYFVTDDADQTVTVYYRHTNPATVTVKLLDENGVQFNSYTVTGTFGVEMKIVPGAYTGYEFNGTADEKANGVKVTPTVDGPNEVTLKYRPKTNNVTVKLLNTDGDDIAGLVTAFSTTIPVREGEGLTVVAPNIPGHSLKSEKPVVSLNASEIQNEPAKRTVTFTYDTVGKANFVTHTVVFKLDGHDLYRHQKLVKKGTGTPVIYDESSISYVVPGFTLRGITYTNAQDQAIRKDEVTDAIDATITYSFSEDAAQIVIKHVDNAGAVLKKDGKDVPNQVLTGYRNGQTDVVVVAPALDGFVLVGDLTQTVNTLTSGSNEVSFTYTTPGNVTLTLKEKTADGTDRIIRVLSPSSTTTYTAGTGDLDLTQYGYTYSAENTTVFNQDNKLEITDIANVHNYDIYYTKQVRNVQYILVDKDKLGNGDPSTATGEQILAMDTVTGDARVGESYVAAARQLSGYTLADSLTKVISKVENNNTDPVKVYFLYTKKATGDVRIIFQKDNDQSTLFTYTVTAAVGEDFTASAPSTWEDGKYTLTGNANKTVTVQNTNADIVFEYASTFVTVNTSTDAGGTTTARDSVTVKKGGDLSLTPPSMIGYELVGITATDYTLDGAGDTTLPNEWDGTTLKLTLANLTADTTVVYHYKPVEQTIGKYQATVTVTDKYNGLYDIGTWTQVVTKNVESTITPKSYADYILTGYQVEGDANVTLVNETDAPTFKLTHTFTGNTAVTFIYASTDGSITVPGGDGNIGGGDDVVVKPNDPQKPEYVQDDKPEKGSVKVPDGGTVMTPDGPIVPPDGSIVKPDGTIVVPDGNDGFDTIYPKPPVPIPGYVTVTYKANNGTQEKDALRIGKGSVAIQNDTTGLGFTTPANKTFSKWTTDENGHNAMTQTHVTEDTTLYAQWTGSTYAQSITITFNSNTGETRLQTIGVYSSSTISGTLDPNPFRVDGWNFGGWNTDAAGNGVGYTDRQSVSFPQGTADPTLYAQWYRVNVDGSITVPGKDGNPNTPDDNATANGNGTESPKRKDTGEIEIPKGGSVTTGSGETIPLPDGGILKPDGTVIINRPEGGTITVPGTDGTNPDVTKPNGSPDADKRVVEILYKSNNPQNKKIKSYAVVGDKIKLLPSTSFVYDGHRFLNWRENANTAYTAEAEIRVAIAMTLEAQWAKFNPDGFVELPGQDGKLPAPSHGDNVTVTPDKPGTIKPQPDGSVKVDGGPGTVERPKDPNNTDQGKEEIKVPDGTIVKPDGTIELPDGGGTINPGDKLPDNVPAGYHTVTYTDGANNSYQLVEDGKNATALGSSTFSPPVGKYFHKWKENTSGDEFGAGDEISAAIVTTNPTFTAQWSGLGGDLLTITPGYTSAKQGATIRLQAMINGSAVAADKVTWNVAKLGSAASAGTVSSNGDLTVPANAADRDVFVVTAENNGQTANAYIAVNAPIGGTGGSGGGEGSGSSTRIYTITATAGAHGSIDPEGKVSVKGGSDKVFTISPNNGYRIEEVRVDGRSVGTVSYYIFSNVDENHTISVTFAEARPANNNGIADPTETGVAGWLQTREHIAYLGGYGNGLFGPDDNMTRAQAAQMFYNLLLNKNVDITVDFTDVPADEWYGNAVRTLASLGVIKGIGDGQFAPNRTITRAEFTVIAMRFANVSADVTNPFTDIAMNDWYYTAVTSAVSYGWITGYSDGTFKPMATITRAEVATIVNRMLARTADRNFVDSSAVTRFDDVPATYWAYYNIAEATTAHTHTIDNNGVESWGKQK